MSKRNAPLARRMSVYPCAKGLAFAIIEARGLLVSWGIARLYSRQDEELRQRLSDLVDKYRVRSVYVEQIDGSRRGSRSRLAVKITVDYAHTAKLTVADVNQTQMRTVLGLRANSTRHEVAVRICELLPELETQLPLSRRPWQPENERISVFIAAALALAGAAGTGTHILKSIR